MKFINLYIFHAVFAIVGILFLSGCNGEKLDSNLIDSITGKVSVEKITIDQEDFEMTEGESTTLTATVLPADATDKTVSWHSSKEEVVMISNTGKVMAIAPGKSIITAKAGNKTDFITITVIANAVRVTGISLDKTSIVLKVDDSETLTATVTPPDATNKNVTWTSSDAAVATVENGKVTGVKPGSVTITAKTEDGGMTAECAVTVKTNLAPSVTVGAEHISAVSVVVKGKANLDSSAPSDLMVGFQYSQSEGILPSNSMTVEATDADSQYNYSRRIIGLEPETTYYFRSIVRMSGQDYYGETMSFTTKELSSLLKTQEASEVEPTSATLNGIIDLSDVSFVSENIEYGFYWGELEDSQSTYLAGGEISNNTYFALLSNLSHQTQYWYKSCVKIDGQTFFGEVKIFTTDVVPVTGVSLDKTACTVHTIDSTFTLTATINPADATNKAVNWKSSNTSVAIVDANGKVTAKGNGSATITVTTDDQGKTATCEVTVAQWVTGITLNKSSVLLIKEQMETVSLTPTVSPSNASDKSVTWSSSNSSVATVDQSGFVTAFSTGTATIMAIANDGSGKSASCEVEVKQYVTGITLNKSSVLLIKGQMETVSLTPTVSPSNASDKSVTWSSSNSSVATVSTAGEVTAVSKGTATIKATANDGSGKAASCEVVVCDVVNLSANGSANCYIVSSAGAYSFRTTKGNSSTSVGSVSSAVVLWESYGTSTTPSVGSIINNVSYSSNTITFSTPATLENGNALIAAKDASGNILWSWHIWVCSGYNPSSSAQTYYNNAGTMMDRNLGATSATPGDVGALGLLYQWGRKDPFLGSSSISSDSKAASTLTWPSPVSSTSNNGTVAYAVENPTTFIEGVGSSNNDWVYSSRINTLWQTSKTVYDPCPPGWRVPDGGSSGVWSKAANTSSYFSHTSTNRGKNFSNKFGSADTIWYPAAGWLGGGSRKMVGYIGYWWSCTPYDYYAYDLYSGEDVYPSGGSRRASGLSVRCLQE